MAEAISETRLIQDYEAIRQREYELIQHVLGVIPKIDNVGEERIGQVRDAMFHADHPFMMVFVGPFSSGKSSIINALLGQSDLLKIGPTPTTDRIQILRYGDDAQDMGSAGEVSTVFYPAEMLRTVSFVDTPGMESIFKEHEATTRKFLHRSDVVVLVMLATQAMSQANADILKVFKDYGKKIIVCVNQSDLLTHEERETVRNYVMNQSKDKLGFEPEVWMVSARQALESRTNGTVNEALWRASGLWRFEEYIRKQLSDADRLRQKLQTPLQIVQNVHKEALKTLRENQSTFDQYRSITENINQQLEAQKRTQMNTVREITTDVASRFSETAERSGDALRDIFQLSRALSSLGRGLLELTGIMRFFRRDDAPSVIEKTFQKYHVFEPIDELPSVVDKLAPRLEGQDMQDIDDLVKYGNREVRALPGDMQNKLIGAIQAPAKYDRLALTQIRDELDQIEKEANEVETEKLELIRRNTLLYFALWELVMVVLIVALFNVWDALPTDIPAGPVALVILLAGALLGFAVLPLRGRAIHTQFTNRLLKLQSRYTELLTKACDKQIEFGMQLRRETIAPLTRLVEAQATIQDEQLASMKDAEQQIQKIESDLNALGKRKIFGLKL